MREFLLIDTRTETVVSSHALFFDAIHARFNHPYDFFYLKVREVTRG